MTKSAMHPLFLLAFAALAQADGTVSWQQVGGTLQATPTLKGLVGQGYETPAPAGPGSQVQSGFLAHPLLVAHAPFVVSGLTDLERIEGYGRTAIPLDSVFSDIDGDALAYSAIDSGTGTVSSIHGDTLFLSGQAAVSGTSRIVVQATDGSDTAGDTFLVVATRTTALAGRGPIAKKSTELSVSVPRPLAFPAVGPGPGHLGIAPGASDELSVDVLLSGASRVSVSIFDNLGSPVISFDRDVASGDLRNLERTPDGRQILPITWNLRSAGGTAVPAGVYLWKIEVGTSDGRKLQTIKRLGVKEKKR